MNRVSVASLYQGLIWKNNLGGDSRTNLFLNLRTGGSEGVLKPTNEVWQPQKPTLMLKTAQNETLLNLLKKSDKRF